MPKPAGGPSKSKTAFNAGAELSEEIKKAVSERAAKRLLRKQEKERKIEELKNEGDQKFKQRLYLEAMGLYRRAVDECGANALLNFNLATTYYNLGWYEDAEDAATAVLMYKPKNIKARLCRGMARKALGNLKAALADFKTIVSQDPSCQEAAVQREIVSQDLVDEEDDDDYSTDDDWPGYDGETANTSSDESDSSDCGHVGGGVSCWFYNHKGCFKGTKCRSSHAPDKQSVRDTLGKNVCILFLLHRCDVGWKCVYSHSRAGLSHGWWNHEKYVVQAQNLLALVDENELAEVQAFFCAIEAMSRAYKGNLARGPTPTRAPIRLVRAPPAKGGEGRSKAEK